MDLTEGADRTGRLSTAPDPHQRHPAETGRIVQHPDPMIMADREHTTRRTAVLYPVGVDPQHQPLPLVHIHVQNV
jgi:hypothetical protein